MIFVGQIVVLILAILGIIWVWRNPRYFLPIVIISLPLDISREWFPHIALLDKLGAFVGVINFARIFSLTYIAYLLFSWVKPFLWRDSIGFEDLKIKEVGGFWRNPLFIALMAYIVWGLASSLWSVNSFKSVAESMRMIILLLLGIATYTEILRRGNAWFIPKAFSLMSTLLGLLGIYQMIFKKFLWMGEIYRAAGRINATFIDANIYARFLIIGILATLIWMISKPDRQSAIHGAFSLIVQFTALIGTGSRTGWLSLILVLFMFVILIPRRQLIYVFLGLGVASLLGLALHPEFVTRIADLQKGLAIASLERQYLIKAGWDMFITHPWLGVGHGGFQTMMFTSYPDLIYNEISLSHTAIITTAAELGIIGLFILAGVLLLVYQELYLNWGKRKISFKPSGISDNWLMVVFSVLSITVIFLSAQGEGRFFEDPALWIFVGFSVALRNVEEGYRSEWALQNRSRSPF